MCGLIITRLSTDLHRLIVDGESTQACSEFQPCTRVDIADTDALSRDATKANENREPVAILTF